MGAMFAVLTANALESAARAEARESAAASAVEAESTAPAGVTG